MNNKKKNTFNVIPHVFEILYIVKTLKQAVKLDKQKTPGV